MTTDKKTVQELREARKVALRAQIRATMLRRRLEARRERIN